MVTIFVDFASCYKIFHFKEEDSSLKPFEMEKLVVIQIYVVKNSLFFYKILTVRQKSFRLFWSF